MPPFYQNKASYYQNFSLPKEELLAYISHIKDSLFPDEQKTDKSKQVLTVSELLNKERYQNHKKSRRYPTKVKASKIADYLYIYDYVNERIKQWGIDELNSLDCRFQFKMEAIADRAFFIAKKNYILHILNDEGFHVEKESKRWKYKGVKLVSAGMPSDVKPLVKKVVHDIVMNDCINRANELYMETYEQFKLLKLDEIALIKSLNKYDEYANGCKGWNTAFRMLAHYRGAYYYNKLLDDMDLTSKYTSIKQSDKVKYLYLVPNNKFGVDVISYIDNYPKEFDDFFTIDTTRMFEKCVTDVIKQFYDALDWHILSPNKQTKSNISDDFLL